MTEVSKRTNVSPIITGEALTAAATAGVGSAVKRAATGMNAVDTLSDATKLGTKTGVDYNLTLKLGAKTTTIEYQKSLLCLVSRMGSSDKGFLPKKG